VLEVSAGRAILSAGTAAGFTEGAHVKIVSQRPVTKPDLTGQGTHQVPSGEVTAVIPIEQADARRAMARLGRGDVAEPGDVVSVTTERLSERLFVPRRAPFRARAGFHLRPFLGLEGTTKPFGALADLYADYYPEQWPVRFEVALAPVGLAIGSATTHTPATALFTAAYTSDYFEVGLGAGGLLGQPGPMQQTAGLSGPVNLGLEDNTGLTVNQTLRLGSVDGINFTWQSSIFSRPDRFVFGVGRAEVNVPLTRRLGLFGAGGAGENGWGFGELGVRTYLNGSGAAGTLLLSASLGYASVFDGWDAQAGRQEMVGGPSVAFGMEWRL
jgi:hypothetical protein